MSADYLYEMTKILELSFWIAIILVFYSYLGYGLVLYLFKILTPKSKLNLPPDLQADEDCPDVALLIAAWNEEDFIQEKLNDTKKLNYPEGKLTVYIITDGTTDQTTEIARNFDMGTDIKLEVHHKDGRSGKQAAIERVLPLVKAPIVIFTDANTYLNKMAIRNIVRHYQDPMVAGVAGEKRIMQKSSEAAAGAGEGLYWKYESLLKKWDSEFHTVVGAAGELFSIRRELIPHVPKDTLVEDFYTTMKLCEKGYRVAYAPDAYAEETSSANVREEMKRKVRIAAGGLQAASRLTSLLNPINDWKLSFQYIGHRLMRWTVAPALLPVIFILNLLLAVQLQGIYIVIFALQCLFYLAALAGYFFERREVRFKPLFVPMYFTMMNISVYRGLIRLTKQNQSVNWEKAKRAPVS